MSKISCSQSGAQHCQSHGQGSNPALRQLRYEIYHQINPGRMRPGLVWKEVSEKARYRNSSLFGKDCGHVGHNAGKKERYKQKNRGVMRCDVVVNHRRIEGHFNKTHTYLNNRRSCPIYSKPIVEIYKNVALDESKALCLGSRLNAPRCELWRRANQGSG